MLAHAAAAWSGRRVLVLDLDTQCNASLMLVGGEAWDKARRQGTTIADYFFDRFDKVAEDESAYVLERIGDVAHPRTARGCVSLLPGSLLLGTSQLYLRQAKTSKDPDAVGAQVRTRMRRLMKHFGMDYDLVILDCPPGLSFAALAAIDLADKVIVPFRPDYVSQFALDRVALLIENVETADQLADIPLAKRRYACLPNCLRSNPRERMLLEQIALDHPLLKSSVPQLESLARAFDWDETQKTMAQKYGDGLPFLKSLAGEVFGSFAPLAKIA